MYHVWAHTYNMMTQTEVAARYADATIQGQEKYMLEFAFYLCHRNIGRYLYQLCGSEWYSDKMRLCLRGLIYKAVSNLQSRTAIGVSPIRIQLIYGFIDFPV
jgi:hypothetical protein